MEYQQFINFLKKHNCYDVFMDNFINFVTNRDENKFLINMLHGDMTRGKILTIEELFAMFQQSSISTAFAWSKTPQRYVYWNNIDKIFRKLWNTNNL